MANTTKKKVPAKMPAKKPVAKAVQEELEDKQPDPREGYVKPMHEDAYKMALTIINRADVKGGDAEAVVLLKRELARVSGQQPGLPRS